MRHLRRLAASRLYRLMKGLMRKSCPETEDGTCYWCHVPMHYSNTVYIGDLRGHHHEWCPWREVTDYKQVWEQDNGGSEAGLPEADGDPAGERVRPVD